MLHQPVSRPRRATSHLYKEIVKDKRTVRAVNGEKLLIVGSIKTTMKHNDKVYHTKVFVFEDITQPILSKTGCKALGLISQKFPNCYTRKNSSNELMNLPSHQAKMTLLEKKCRDRKSIQEKCRLSRKHVDLVDGAIPVKKFKPYTIPIHWQKESKYCEYPEKPMDIVYCDIFKTSGYSYLVMSDKYSNWPWVEHINRCTTSSIISILRSWFAAYGFPKKLVSDGGPQFKSIEFRNWCHEHGINHRMASSYHPESNGQAKASVQSMKHLIIKTATKGKFNTDAFAIAITKIRNSPRLDGLSPAQLMFGRQTRTLLPVHKSAFYRPIKKNPDIQEKYGTRYTVQDMPSLRIGQRVLVQNPKTRHWDKQATIIEISDRERSYIVQGIAGGRYHRNRKHLKPDNKFS